MPESWSERRKGLSLPAPESRDALVEELRALVTRAATLTHDEAAVLRHLFANAGYGLDDRLRIPELAVLWGGAGDSYFPAVRLPAERVRAAAATLRRRGVLRGVVDAHAEGIVVDKEALRALAEKAAPPAEAVPAAAAARRRVILRVAIGLDGFVAKPGAEAGAELAANVDLRRGDPAKRIARLLKEPGGDLICEGGAAAVHALLKKDLVDVLTVQVLPVLLGRGVPLFKKGRPERKLKLESCRAYPSGLVQLRYERA